MTGTEERKAVIYARVANNAPVSAEDRGFTIAGQERSCREYAQEKGYAVAAMFSDVGSGNAVDRPGFNAMLAYLRKQREPHVVLVESPSRIARNVGATLKLCNAMSQAGASLDSPAFQRGKVSVHRWKAVEEAIELVQMLKDVDEERERER